MDTANHLDLRLTIASARSEAEAHTLESASDVVRVVVVISVGDLLKTSVVGVFSARKARDLNGIGAGPCSDAPLINGDWEAIEKLAIETLV